MNQSVIVSTNNFSDKAADSATSQSETKLPTKVEKSATDPSKYNSTEYYTYTQFSYYDIDAVCVESRIPQPSASFKPKQNKLMPDKLQLVNAVHYY